VSPSSHATAPSRSVGEPSRATELSRPPTTLGTIHRPDPLVIPWRGRSVRIRHDDPHLGLYTDIGKPLSAGVQLATDVSGLRLVLASTVADPYGAKVSDEGSVKV
jgi:hypothetical protein